MSHASHPVSSSLHRLRRGALALGLLACTAGAQATEASIASLVQQRLPAWTQVYKDLHQHPELALQETRTAAVLAKRMKALGLEVTEHVGGTGVVALLRNGDGPLVMVRTDMDALPMAEQTGLPYASKVTTTYKGAQTGVMHACGHDAHMAIWLATAEVLARHKDQWRGTVMFVGQPAEETLEGAKAMLADGVFQRFGTPDHAFALHVGPDAYDRVSINTHAVTSASGAFDITFHGRGGHGSAPHRSIDPVMMASRFVVDLQSVASREKDPQQFGVVGVGMIAGGSAGNIIPAQATVRGTVRWYDEAVGDGLLAGIERTARAVQAMADAPPAEINITRGTTAVFNDEALATRTAQAITAALPGGQVALRDQPGTASEDYAAFSAQVSSSVFFGIGIYDPAAFNGDHSRDPALTPFNHSPTFAPIPEPTLRTGTLAMTAAVLDVLKPAN
ncbi:MAG: amidohydrolase [Pseudoxanthomonas sp.]